MSPQLCRDVHEFAKEALREAARLEAIAKSNPRNRRAVRTELDNVRRALGILELVARRSLAAGTALPKERV